MLETRGFQKLYFGKASAEAELAGGKGAEYFFRTFYDRWNIRAKIEAKEFFLVVGPKGSGKSAINEFIYLYLVDRYGEYSVHSQTLNLDEVGPGVVPLTEISSKLVSSQQGTTTEQAWRLFLTLRMFDLLLKDQSCSLLQDAQVSRLHKDLQAAGLVGSDYPTILRRVRENKIKIGYRGTGAESGSRVTDDLPVAQVSEAILRIILAARSENHFVLSIDGLDRIIGDNPSYWHTLAALLRVGDELHGKFSSAEADLRIFVMCRSDVLRRIRFADADKITGDSALFVDWGAQLTIPRDSSLWDYLASKAGISVEQLFAYFPDAVTVGERGRRPKKISTAEYLLHFTRSTPREMTLLMKRIQEQLPAHGYVTPERIRAAADEFASRDLLSIVNAESTGILHDQLGDRLEEIISEIASAGRVDKKGLAEAVKSAGLDERLTSELAEFLFMAGLLGNADPNTGYFQFYHRRDTYKFKREGPWALHNALMYAFNKSYSRGRE